MPLTLNICLRCSSVIKNLTLLTFSIEILMSRKWWWNTVIRFADDIKLVIISPVSVLKDRVVSAGTLTGWSKGPTQTSLKSTSKNGKEKPSEQYSLGKAKEQFCGKGLRDPGRQWAGYWPAVHCAQSEDQQHPWLCEQGYRQKTKEAIIPFLCLLDHIWSTAFHFGLLLMTRKTLTSRSKFRDGTEHLLWEERLVQPRAEAATGTPHSSPQCVWGDYKVHRVRLVQQHMVEDTTSSHRWK